MNEDQAYLDIARRYLESCEKHIHKGINIQEVLAFNAYHAFESIAGAYNSHYGHQVSKRHKKKLETFLTNSRRHGNVNPHALAALIIFLSSMRENYLYPEILGTIIKRPQDQVSLTNAKTIIRRVRGIVRQVEKVI